MGWGSGTEVAESMIDLCQEYVPEKNHKPFLTAMFQVLESMDWDCQGDLLRHKYPLVGNIVREMHPDWFCDEEDDENEEIVYQ